MFDLDKWQEIYHTIKKNKLRSFLTAFSVAWGIFMLIVLLGSGNGLENGVKYQFEQDATNSIWIYGGQTSVAYKGMKPGRFIRFKNEDYNQTNQKVKAIESSSARMNVFGKNEISYQNQFGSFRVTGIHPGTYQLERCNIVEGRFINQKDVNETRKVVVIPKLARNALLKDTTKSLMGEFINVNGIPFMVVGMFYEENERDMDRVYIPIATAQMVFNTGDYVGNIAFTTNALNAQDSRILTEQIKQQFASRHKFDPGDQKAIFVNNNIENMKQFTDLFMGIRIFVWIIGIGTIIAGMVGVSNIMIIVVKERTKEIGIRKAVGATPGSIVGLIMFEAILITTVAGYFGLISGVGLMELIQPYVKSDFFRDPQADFRIAIGATITLILSGAIAGYIPARKAARIKPVEALRDE